MAGISYNHSGVDYNADHDDMVETKTTVWEMIIVTKRRLKKEPTIYTPIVGGYELTDNCSLVSATTPPKKKRLLVGDEEDDDNVNDHLGKKNHTPHSVKVCITSLVIHTHTHIYIYIYNLNYR